MGNETRKTNKIRGQLFIDKYFQGSVIDIGGGNDPVTPNAKVFDLKDGDAQYIANYEDMESYDCVHSSHCLEHMVDVPKAMLQWWSLVKRGGYMIITVPHEDLYEQKIWPSIFNDDHKATFRLNNKTSWSNVSYDLHELCQTLQDVIIIDTKVQDDNYDYNLQYKKIPSKFRRIYRWQFSKNKIKRYIGKLIYKTLYHRHYVNTIANDGVPIDQTGSNALAQIQVVLQKKF
jgi:SAM-dependent methyltransferase